MADDLDFNINMNNDHSGQNVKLNNAPSSNTGYSYNKPTNNTGGYSEAQQLDSSTQNVDENVSMFDIRRAAHPVASLFTFLFKVIGIVSYLFLKLIYSDTTFIFIVVVLCGAFDFWTVKNVTGRLLVGLRWWSEILPNGSEIWHFESHDKNVKINGIDRRVFWWSQSISCAFWALISFVNLISLSLYWSVCSGICLALSGINYWGYYKCSKDHQKKISSLVTNTALGGLTKGFGIFK